MENRIFIDTLLELTGKDVTLFGWVDNRRDHGKLIFLDLRDASGKIQAVVLPQHTLAHVTASVVRSEWVLKITGTINTRPEKMVNKDEVLGTIELEIKGIEVLNEAETPVFDITTDTRVIGEETRLSNRYLDLRSTRLQNNIRARAKIMKVIREYLTRLRFVEIETPLLTKSTPEGARDYLVPSRIDQGKFYALPQSPQQYKQLLMASGFERYFQFAKCMRDEDTRGDRQPEFTQLDMEMSFVSQEDIMALNEKLLIEIVETLYPEKHIQQIPFPRITYKEATEKYGSDRPDVRENKKDPHLLAFCWVVDFPFFEKTEKGEWTFTHNPFSMPTKEHLDALMNKKDVGSILTTQYDIVLNGFEIGGGSLRGHTSEVLAKVFEVMGFTEERIEKNFGHMLRAFKSGTPPHGGIAWGFDRFVMLLQGEANIREVIAFPKTGEGRELMLNSPSEADPDQLRDLGITFRKENK